MYGVVSSGAVAAKPDQLPLVVAPDPPPCSDTEMAGLLERAAFAIGGRWLTLDLELEQSGRCYRYAWGDPEPVQAEEVQLALSGLYSARVWCSLAVGEALVRLVPLLESALEQLLAARILRHQASMMRCALDTTRRAILLFDNDGNIVHANPAGDALLSRQTESGLRVRLAHGASQPLVTALCRRVERHDPADRQSSDRLTLEDGSQLACEILSLASSELNAGRSTMVVLEPVGRHANVQQQLDRAGTAHHLTAREREVLALLCDGLSTNAVATVLCISPHTVRDHIKRLYRKTGTRSRAELVRLVE